MMKSVDLKYFAWAFLACIFLPAGAFAQSGKISGTVTGPNGNALPGVNVVVVNTQKGASTDAKGEYTILNVRAGNHDVKASFVGYADQIVEDVNVRVDLTSTVDIQMQSEEVGLEEVTVKAEEKVVQPDVSSNIATVGAEEAENLPGVSSLTSIVSQQPGVAGFGVRGGALSETKLVVDGYAMRDNVGNEPARNISFTAIDQVQVQTGGFNAEYGNVRSGLVNVVTKDAPRNRYIADALVKYSAPTQKNFGPVVGSPNAFYRRSYLDPDVAFTGTFDRPDDGYESPWDYYMQQRYPMFEGWNQVAENYNQDKKKKNQATPEQFQKAYKYYTRRDTRIQVPDYTIDATIGGPLTPNGSLGDLRFVGSFRRDQDAYLLPQIVDARTETLGNLTLTSDLTRDIKLDLRGRISRDVGIDPSNKGFANMASPNNHGYYLDNILYDLTGGATVFGNTLSKISTDRNVLAAGLTHTLSDNTFYEVHVQRSHDEWLSGPDRNRDTTTIVKKIGPFAFDETPFGYTPENIDSYPIEPGITTGGDIDESRDSSRATQWSGTFDLTSQLTHNVQIKTGATYISLNHHRDFDFVSKSGPRLGYGWDRNPRQGAAYAQTKIEFQGLIANAGLRLDYFNPGGTWYGYSRYDQRLAGQTSLPTPSTLDTVDTKAQLALSPRLGVSFPISENSKVFFNYGHFRQMLSTTFLYKFDTGIPGQYGSVNQLGNPSHPMPKTVSYELGFEQNLFDRFLFRLTGFYKDVSNQAAGVSFHSANGDVNYSVRYPLQYRDIRGFEALIKKTTGWYRGQFSFTYDSRKGGRYGLPAYYQNDLTQRETEETFRASQNTRIPQPRAYGFVALVAPEDFGPTLGGVHPLADFRLGARGTWRSGRTFTWGGPNSSPAELQNNVQWKPRWMLDLKLSKNFNTSAGDFQFFANFANILNLRQMSSDAGEWSPKGFGGYNNYMQSLHLPKDIFKNYENENRVAPYDLIPGDDQPGDTRKLGTKFIPIEPRTESLDAISMSNRRERPLYYKFTRGEPENGTYYRWKPNANGGKGAFQEADSGFVNKVLENKQYINMPAARWATFLEPRDITFGFRFTF